MSISAQTRISNFLDGRRVYIAGHRGLVGAALARAIAPQNAHLITRTSTELDLRDQSATADFFTDERPEIVFFAAGRVGGIGANSSAPAQFLYDNLAMATNAIHSAYEAGTEQFVFFGSTCIYPREAPQPMPESCLMSSALEPTNEAYALAKITGLKLCQFYRRQYGVLFHSIMPTNLYGPGDNYHLGHAHVLPALLRRFHEAKESGDTSVTIWGTGSALREFLHVDDLAAAVLYIAALDNPPDWINIGSGDEVSILELAHSIAEIVGFQGDIVADTSKPDGTPRKLADSSLLAATGWKPRISLRDGLQQTYNAFLAEQKHGLLRSV